MKFIKNNFNRKESTDSSIGKVNGIKTTRSVPFIKKESTQEEAALTRTFATSSNKKIKTVLEDIRLANKNKV